MYAKHFGLRTDAFALTPDPAFLYLSPDHAEALAALKIGLEGRRGLMMMVGEVGMGKTTLLYSLLSDLNSEIHTAYISNTRLSFDEILRQALKDFGVPCTSRDRLEMLDALNGFLHRCASSGETAALIVDEAQNLDEDSFENVRLLSNYETYTEKLLQIVLVGQPELDAKLARASLRQVTERVAVRCHINPLTDEEALRYLEHRLQCAGGSTAIFTPAALRLVLRAARGIPRRLNIIAHNALLFAYGQGLGRVSAAEATAAIREKRGQGLVTVGIDGRLTLRVRQGLAYLRGGWRIAAAVAAAAFAIGWAFGYLGGRTKNEPGPQSHANAQPSAARVLEAPPAPSLDGALAALAAATRVADAQAKSAPEIVTAPAPITAAAPVVHVVPALGTEPGPAAAVPAVRQVVVRRGMSLGAIAREHYGADSAVVIDRIKNLNPQIVNANRILAGDTLRLPEPTADAIAQDDARE